MKRFKTFAKTKHTCAILSGGAEKQNKVSHLMRLFF